MIEKADVDAALAAARHDLDSMSGLAWIKQSAMLERAYYLGLFTGLSGIAKAEDVSHILVRAIAVTLSARPADDTFDSTPTGQVRGVNYYCRLATTISAGEGSAKGCWSRPDRTR